MGCACGKTDARNVIRSPKDEVSKVVIPETTLVTNNQAETLKNEDEDVKAEISDFLKQVYQDAEKKLQRAV